MQRATWCGVGISHNIDDKFSWNLLIFRSMSLQLESIISHFIWFGMKSNSHGIDAINTLNSISSMAVWRTRCHSATTCALLSLSESLIYFPFLCFSFNLVHARRHMNSLIFWCAVVSASSSCYWCANCVSPNSPIVTDSFGLRTENFRVENFSMSFHCLFRSRCIRYSIVSPCLIAYARETNFQNGWTMSTHKLRRRRRRRLCHAMIEIR